MKTLYLLRHAQAMPLDLGNTRDHERPLTPKGQMDANALGREMMKRALLPDLVLCSSARRTQETCRIMKQHFPREISTHFLPTLYETSKSGLFHIIQGTRDTADTLLVIGHNPALHELCAAFSTHAPETIVHRLMQGYPPATLSVITFPQTEWEQIELDSGKISLYLTPQDYNAPQTPTRWM